MTLIAGSEQVPANDVGAMAFKQLADMADEAPRTDHITDLYYKLIWVGRFVTKNEYWLKRFEQYVQERILAQSKTHGEGRLFDVPRIKKDDIDKKSLKQIISCNFPVIIEGFLNHSRAVNEWSLDFLKARCGESKIHVVHENIKGDDLDTKHYHVHSVSVTSVSQLVDSVRMGGNKYGAASASIFGEHKALLDEINLPGIQSSFGRNVVRPEIFIGGPKNHSYYHCAVGGNIFCQIHGEKKWVLVSPSHSKWLYPNIGHSGTGLYFGSPIITTNHEKDPSRYPLYTYIPKYAAHLRSGDVLYNPPWWWHEVSNVTESIGVALRVLSLRGLGSTNLLFSLLTFSSPTLIKTVLILLKNKILNSTGCNMDFDDNKIRGSLHHKKD